MNLDPLFSLGSKIFRIFRIFGKLAFVTRLHDFLIHEGRHSRAEVLEKTVDAVFKMQKAEAQRIKNSRELVNLMKDAGFSEEQIEVASNKTGEIQNVSLALAKLLTYVNNGDVTLRVVSPPENELELLDISKRKRLSRPRTRHQKAKVIKKKKKEDDHVEEPVNKSV